MASLAPSQPPIALQKAMGIAKLHMILPLLINRQIEPKLVAKLTIFALAEAFKKSKPNKATNPKTRKLPVPGPINPS